MSYTFALAGNQNSGKTTLFNQLTGSNQHVGNWPGVTVEQKTGTMIHHHHGNQTHIGLPSIRRRSRRGRDLPREFTDVHIVDLPGIYSLSPYSMEEIVSRNYIVHDKPDVVINCVDATNLERNLYLTLQLLELGRPTVVALNMMDEVRHRGDTIDIRQMEQAGRAGGGDFRPPGRGIGRAGTPRHGAGPEPYAAPEARYLRRGGA